MQSSHKYCQWHCVMKNFALQQGKSRGTIPCTPSECSSGLRTMEWTELHMLVTTVGLLKARHSTTKIHILLRPLKVNEHHVYRVKKIFEGKGNVWDCPRASLPHSTRTKNGVNGVQAWITRNPCLVLFIYKMWWMWYVLESLETLVTKNFFPKRWIWCQEPFHTFSQKTCISELTKGTPDISSMFAQDAYDSKNQKSCSAFMPH